MKQPVLMPHIQQVVLSANLLEFRWIWLDLCVLVQHKAAPLLFKPCFLEQLHIIASLLELRPKRLVGLLMPENSSCLNKNKYLKRSKRSESLPWDWMFRRSVFFHCHYGSKLGYLRCEKAIEFWAKGYFWNQPFSPAKTVDPLKYPSNPLKPPCAAMAVIMMPLQASLWCLSFSSPRILLAVPQEHLQINTVLRRHPLSEQI